MSLRPLLLGLPLLATVFAGCGIPPTESLDDSISDTPTWSHDVVWYQIFVERFRNGDPSNDPTLHDITGSWPHHLPPDWEPTSWTHDWYEQEDWAKATGEHFYHTVQIRRYGGDLQGILDKLDYLEDLGVTALYLNPINDSPSLHKYDARHYRHVDRNFGPDPAGDEAIAAAEDPADPATWQWTAADSLFLVLVQAVHDRGMRIILDYSWNHTGMTFWAWQDVLEKQRASAFAEWYDVASFDDPTTPDTNEFAYHGWYGVKELPELKKVNRIKQGTTYEGNLWPEFKEHVYHVTRRWLDPDGDGDPSDGIDGFRLDVADLVPLGFWREYRQFVRGINPEAYLLGEVWWDSFPHRLMDPEPWLRGDVFDAVMNYRWYMPTRSFFANAPPHLTASQYVAHLDSIEREIGPDFLKAMMNLTASHDSPRFGTSIYNPGLYKYQGNPNQNPTYRIDKPDARTRKVQQMILVQQFTYVGAPHIWNGDEVGMWGGDDPDMRKPIVWEDLSYDDEVAHPGGLPRRRDAVRIDTALLSVYRQLIALRKQHARLFVDGAHTVVVTDDDRRLLAYQRTLGDARAVVAFNASDTVRTMTIPALGGAYYAAFPTGATVDITDDTITATMDPLSARIWIKR